MIYKLKDKEVEIEFYWPTIYLTSIEKWNNGLEISEKEKSLMLIDLLFYCEENGSKAKVAIDKNHIDKDFWLAISEKNKYKIGQIELFDKEERFQNYIDDLAKAFTENKTITINNKVINNRSDLEIAFRNKQQSDDE